MDKTLRILILEDNPTDAELMEYELADAGIAFTSKRVMTEEAFLQAIEEFSPDVILSDYDLPQYNGAMALAESMKRCPDVPFILVTGAVSEDRAIEILTSGARDYVLKRRLGRLVPAVRRALAEVEAASARKAAEEELRESEKRAREQLEEIQSIYNSAHIGLCVFDRELRYVRINQRLAEMNGIPAADHIGKAVREIVPQIAPMIEKTAGRIFQSGEPVLNSELRGTFGASGIQRTVLEQWRPLKDAEGNVIGINVVVEDITERKRMEEELLRSHEALEDQVKKRTAELEREVAEHELAEKELLLKNLAFNASLAANSIADLDGSITQINPAFLRIWGYRSKDEVIGKSIPDFLRNKEEAASILKALNETGKWEGIAEAKRKDGSTFIAQGLATLVEDADGKVIGYQSAVLDITKRTQVEEALVKSESRFRTIFEQAPLGIALMDTQTSKFLEINPKFCEILGRTEEEMRKLIFQNVTHPDDLPASVAYNKLLVEGKVRFYKLEKRYLRPDGSVVWVDLTILAMWGAEEGPSRHIAMIEDITNRKLAEEALRRSEERLKKTQEIAHIGSWELDVENNRLSWSDEVYRIYGLRPQEFAATYDAFLEAVHPDDREAVDIAYTGSLCEGQNGYEITHRILRKPNGEIRIVHEKCEHFRDETGRIIRSVGMVHDITESKPAE